MNSVDGYLAFLVERNFRIEGKISGGIFFVFLFLFSILGNFLIIVFKKCNFFTR